LHQARQHDFSSGRLTVQASSVQTTRTFHPDLPLCQEPSNCSWLHPSKCLSNTAERLFNVRQGKGLCSKTQIWEDSCNRLDDVCSRLDAQASYMEIACISSTIRTSAFMVWTLKALIWKLRVAKVQPSECGPIHERISCKFKKLVAQLSVRTLLATVRTTPRKYKSNANLDSCSL
jgi:hypothetical protein